MKIARFVVITLGLMLCVASNARADALDNMISPIANPVNFEDPRINTELRPIFMNHKIDGGFITQGGDVQLYALQARFALTDRLAFIATKDGFIDFNPNAVVPKDSGIANIAAGLKYAFYVNEDEGQILTGGLRYEIPLGDKDVLQGNGDGQFNPFMSAAAEFAGFNLMLGTGFRIPISDNDSTFYDFDVHVDYPIGNFYPALELQVVTVLDAGQRLGIPDEGQDLFNFGATGAEGESIVTAGPSFRYRFCDDLDGGFAYQVPLSGGEGSNITDWRITADFIYSFNFN